LKKKESNFVCKVTILQIYNFTVQRLTLLRSKQNKQSIAAIVFFLKLIFFISVSEHCPQEKFECICMNKYFDCKSQTFLLFHSLTCSRFTWLVGWLVVSCLSPCQIYLINLYNAIFLKSQWSEDIKNDILDCQIHKYTNTITQIHKYSF